MFCNDIPTMDAYRPLRDDETDHLRTITKRGHDQGTDVVTRKRTQRSQLATCYLRGDPQPLCAITIPRAGFAIVLRIPFRWVLALALETAPCDIAVILSCFVPPFQGGQVVVNLGSGGPCPFPTEARQRRLSKDVLPMHSQSLTPPKAYNLILSLDSPSTHVLPIAELAHFPPCHPSPVHHCSGGHFPPV